MRRRCGSIWIPARQYNLNLIKSFPPMLVLFHEFRMDKEQVHLVAECDLFDRVGEGYEVPDYDIIFDSNGFKKFRRVEK